jgi:hypothetical protein
MVTVIPFLAHIFPDIAKRFSVVPQPSASIICKAATSIANYSTITLARINICTLGSVGQALSGPDLRICPTCHN